VTDADSILAKVEEARTEIVDLLQELVRIPTVNTGTMPTGNETEACLLLQKRLRREGIEADVIESQPTRGNLLASLPGGVSDRGARLMFLSHLDVVPVGDETQWKVPPFSGLLQDGRIYGRGAWDCKGVTACQVMAAVLLKRAGGRLDRSLLLAATADEETARGAPAGLGYLLRDHADRLACDYVLNEGGGACVDTPDGVYFVVSTGEKGRSELTLDFEGRSCHASQPWSGQNPLEDMARAIKGIQAYAPELKIDPSLLDTLWRLLRLPGAPEPGVLLGILSSELRSSPLYSTLRGMASMTIAPTLASAGYRANVVPDRATLTCDVRTLPGQDESYVRSEVERMIGRPTRCRISLDKIVAPSSSGSDGIFLDAIARSVSRVTSAPAGLLEALSIGYTDSMLMRPGGAVAYGFEPAHPRSDPRLVNIHGANESIAVDDLVFRTQVYVALCLDLLTSAGPE